MHDVRNAKNILYLKKDRSKNKNQPIENLTNFSIKSFLIENRY